MDRVVYSKPEVGIEWSHCVASLSDGSPRLAPLRYFIVSVAVCEWSISKLIVLISTIYSTSPQDTYSTLIKYY